MTERGLDPPAVNMSISSSPSWSEEEEDEEIIVPTITEESDDAGDGNEDALVNAPTTTQSEPELTPEGSEGEGGASLSEEDEEEEYEEESDGNEHTAKSKRVSYSKEMLKPTREGSLISQGEDVRAASQSKEHKPGYINKKLKATGYGDKLKKGDAVPRDQPDDPNAKLGEMYKAVKLKQGPREESLPAKNSSIKEPEYASVTLKKSGNPEETRRKSDESSSPTELQSIKLNKAEPIVRKEKKRSSFPEVKLNKTEAIVKDSKKHFELPKEFSQAKQNLKRRTERPWYSNFDEKKVKASKKWFFQKGEWNDGSEPKPKKTSTKEPTRSWFFGSSNSPSPSPPAGGTVDGDEPGAHVFRGSHTRITTGKDLVKTQHFNELSNANNNSKKSLKTNYNKQYYEDLQRRRKGLPPKRRRRGILWTVFVWFIIVPAMLGSAVFCGNIMFPDQVDAAWKQLQPHIDEARKLMQPKVEPIIQQLKPHIVDAVGKVEPHAAAVIEQVRPYVVDAVQQVQPHVNEAVDHVCSLLESLEVADNKMWAKTIQGSGVRVCIVMRSKLGKATEEEEEETLESTNIDGKEPGSKEPTNSKRKGTSAKREADTSKDANSNSDDCECDSKRRGWKRLLPGHGRKKRRHPECCNKAAKVEKDL